MEQPTTQRELLLDKLGLNNNSNKEEVKNKLDNTPDEQLIVLLELLWRDTKAYFCRLHKLHVGNFSRWTNGKRVDVKCRNVVIEYLTNLYDSTIIDRTSYFNMRKQEEQIKENYYMYSSDWSKLRDKLLSNKELEIIIFIDADQQMYRHIDLTWMFDDIQQQQQSNVHIVCFSSLITTIPPSWRYSASWCSWVRSPSKGSQSADLICSMACKDLHDEEVRRTRECKLVYLLVSNDYFAVTLTEIMRSLTPKREIFYIREFHIPLYLMIMFYSHKLNIPLKISTPGMKLLGYLRLRLTNVLKGIMSNNEQTDNSLRLLNPFNIIPNLNVEHIKSLDTLLTNIEDNKKKRKNDNLYPEIDEEDIRDRSNTYFLDDINEFKELNLLLKNKDDVSIAYLSQKVPLSEDTKRRFAVSKWRDIIENPILKYHFSYKIIAGHSQVWLNKTKYVEELSASDILRSRYIELWKGTTSDFCDKYGCLLNNFNGFIRKGNEDPICNLAIQKWLGT